MNLNMTLFGQMITFAIFIWITMKFVWPPLIEAMEKRRKTIAEGLAAAELGRKELADAHEKVVIEFQKIRTKTQDIVVQANQKADAILEEAKERAKREGEYLLQKAREDIEQEIEKVKMELRKRYVELVLQGAEKVIDKQIDVDEHLLEKFIEEI